MQPIFKQYNQGQAELFPQRLDDYIGENDPVRLVNQVVDELDLNPIIQSYKRGGTSSFCPRMMIKVQISIENKFITNFGIDQNPGDTSTFNERLICTAKTEIQFWISKILNQCCNFSAI